MRKSLGHETVVSQELYPPPRRVERLLLIFRPLVGQTSWVAALHVQSEDAVEVSNVINTFRVNKGEHEPPELPKTHLRQYPELSTGFLSAVSRS
jgi:hypothetical protein